MEPRCRHADADARGVTYQCDLTEGHAGRHYNADGLHGWSTQRHDIVVTRRGNVHGVTIDGERVRGVRRVEVINDVSGLPLVRIDLLPATVHVDLGPAEPSTPES